MDIRTFHSIQIDDYYFDQNPFSTPTLYSWVCFTTLNNTNNNTILTPLKDLKTIWLHLFCILEMLAHLHTAPDGKFWKIPTCPTWNCCSHQPFPVSDTYSGWMLGHERTTFQVNCCVRARESISSTKTASKQRLSLPLTHFSYHPIEKKNRKRREKSETRTWVTICVNCLLDLQLLSLPAMFSLERNDLKKKRWERLKTGRLNEAPLLSFSFASWLYLLQVFASFPMFYFVSVWRKVARRRHSLSPMTVI